MANEGWLAGCFTKRVSCKVEASFETGHPYLSKSWESGIGKGVSKKLFKQAGIKFDGNENG